MLEQQTIDKRSLGWSQISRNSGAPPRFVEKMDETGIGASLLNFLTPIRIEQGRNI
jgi:hypothetical protein